MRSRFTILACSLSLIAGWANCAFTAALRVDEAVLYVAAPAEVSASLRAQGKSADFGLPRQLLADTVRVTQGDRTLSPLLRPAYAPRKAGQPRRIERYQGRVSGLASNAPVKDPLSHRGLEWWPAMVLKVAGGRGRLEAQASITNNALDLTGARLRLMSGYLAEGALPFQFEDPSDYESYVQVMQELGRTFAAEGGGLHLAAELRDTNIPLGTRRQIPLLATEGSITQTYRWDTSPEGAEAEERGSWPWRARAFYSFRNNASRAIPQGNVTVSEGDTVVGSGYAAWTPPGETALVAVGSVQGLAVHRGEDAKPDSKTLETRHGVNLRVENSRKAKLTLKVVEHLSGRWGYDEANETSVYEFSQPPQVGNKGLLVWDLPVPAHGEASLTYARREPIDTGPLQLIHFWTGDWSKERPYLVEAPQTGMGNPIRGYGQARVIKPDGYIVYRLPVPAGVVGAEVKAALGNSFVASLASEENGKPGKYTPMADAVAIAATW